MKDDNATPPNNGKIIPLGESLKPLLLIIENAIWSYESNNPTIPGFDDEAFRAVIKIFMTALIERIWTLQENENMEFDDRLKMVLKAASDIQHLIKVYTNINTKDLYKELLTLNENE